jgi:hypothetical protein
MLMSESELLKLYRYIAGLSAHQLSSQAGLLVCGCLPFACADKLASYGKSQHPSLL